MAGGPAPHWAQIWALQQTLETEEGLNLGPTLRHSGPGPGAGTGRQTGAAGGDTVPVPGEALGEGPHVLVTGVPGSGRAGQGG